jgi:hypothetical protein
MPLRLKFISGNLVKDIDYPFYTKKYQGNAIFQQIKTDFFQKAFFFGTFHLQLQRIYFSGKIT